MDPLLATLVLILLALLGARVSFSTERAPPGPKLLFRTGTHFVLVGWLVGPAVLELLTEEALTQLVPLLGLGLGWVGLLFGLQLDREDLRQFPRTFYVVAFGQATAAFVVFLALGLAAVNVGGSPGRVALVLTAAAAATACISTPAGIAMVSTTFGVTGNVRGLLFFIASLDAVVGITALQLTYGFFHPGGAAVLAKVVTWTAAAIGLGVVCGIIFLWLLRVRPKTEELVLFLMGISALASGMALQLRVSPLFVSFVLGALVANFARDRSQISRVMLRWEKPVYLTLLMLTGAHFQVTTVWVFVLAAAYAVIRLLAKVVGSALMVVITPLPFGTPRSLGWGLLPQGGISLAMALSLLIVFPDLVAGGLPATRVVFGAIVVGVVLSELLGPVFTVRLLRSVGEIEDADLVSGADDAASPAGAGSRG